MLRFYTKMPKNTSEKGSCNINPRITPDIASAQKPVSLVKKLRTPSHHISNMG